MRLLTIGACLASAFAAWPEPALARQLTVRDLTTMCAKTDASSRASCSFYILGVFEGLSVAGNAKITGGKAVEASEKSFCVPDELGSEKMRQTVLDWTARDLQKFPEDGELPAVSWIGGVISKVYPC